MPNTGQNPDTPFSYDTATAVRYDAAVPVQPGEVEFYLELAQQAQANGLPTLEPACGTGRVTIPLAREGIDITGLDNSAAMLARAREKAAGITNASWLEADMRSFDLPGPFGLAIIPAGSFQLLLTTEAQLDCLRTIFRHLAPGGRLAFEVWNPDLVAIADWLGQKRGAYLRNPARDYRHPESGHNIISWRSQEFHPSIQRQITHGFTEELDDDGLVLRRTYGQSMNLRYFFRYEVEHLLARAGFEPEALYGDYAKSEFRGGSPDMVWVARKPA